MDSILNEIRGEKTLDLQHFIAMPDDEYAAYLAEVRSLKPKKQKLWKRWNEMTDGSTKTIRYDGNGFYTQWLNQRVAVKSVSMIAELEREQLSRGPLHGFSCQGIQNYQDRSVYHTEMNVRQVATHTGNHQPRNHPIRVPTSVGEPVRG